MARLAAVGVLLGGLGVAPQTAGAAAAVPGEFIFVTTSNRYDYWLYAANATTGRYRRVTTQRAVGRPSYSPDGRTIVFSSPLHNDDTLGRYALYRVNRTGTGLRRITTPTITHMDPVWSPDGRTIAYSWDARGNSESNCCRIGLTNTTGTWSASVPNTTSGTFPAWAPDSKRLAFVRPDGLYAINRNGTGRVRLVAGRVTTPDWSPDGRSIAYVQRLSETRSVLRTVPAQGGTPTTRWAPTGHPEAPSWGVDGTTLFATFHRGIGDWARRSSAIYRIPAGGTATKQIDLAREIFFLDYHSLLPAAGDAGVGRVAASGAGLGWQVINQTAAPAQEPTPFVFGLPGDRPVTGDWDRDGADAAGFVRPVGDALEWHLSDGVTEPFTFGAADDIAVSGDWDGDGVDSPGTVRVVADALLWTFRSRNASPATERTLTFGSVINGVPDTPVAGDWDGDGITSIGVTRSSGGDLRWLLNNSTSVHAVHHDFVYGAAGDRPVSGDWDGDRDDTPGVTRGTGDGRLEWSVRNSNTAGASAATFIWGRSGDVPVAGNWDGE